MKSICFKELDSLIRTGAGELDSRLKLNEERYSDFKDICDMVDVLFVEFRSTMMDFDVREIHKGMNVTGAEIVISIDAFNCDIEDEVKIYVADFFRKTKRVELVPYTEGVDRALVSFIFEGVWDLKA